MNRMLFTVIIIKVLVLSSVSLGYSGGSGTSQNPYQIATKADLLALAATTEDYNKCFILTADIDMEGQIFTTAIIAADINSSSGFQGTAFTGTFDGNNLKISHFIIDGGSNDYLGLFGRINSIGLVKNLGIEDCTVSGLSGSYYVGGLVGYNYCNISNCHSTGAVSGYRSVGGLVGYNNLGRISQCHSTSTVGDLSGSRYVGGLVGENSGSISYSYSASVVSGSSSSQNVGGLVGYNNTGSITNCRSTGEVSGSSDSWYFGGLVGSNSGSIKNSYSTGMVAVSGSSYSFYIGGLVGSNGGSITNCYSTGDVNNPSYGYVGGMVGGNSGSITNCYSMGNVSGGKYIGGLVGFNFSFGSITNCYSTGAVSGTSYVGGLVGFDSGSVIGGYFLLGAGPDNGYGEPLTDEQMKQQASFIGWDFLGETANGTCNYWQMPEGGGYPVLSVLNGYIPPEPFGSGTEQDPYIIADANDLGTIWYRPSAYYILANDIDLAPVQWSAAVVPLFSGVFDGNGFSINNLFINGGGLLGLFGKDYPGSQIKNLGLESCTVIGTGSYVGSLAGSNSGSIIDCYSTGDVTVTGTSASVGGLVGENSSSIIDCYSTGTVSGFSSVGGLVGDNDGSIANCYAMGSVSGTHANAGGLAGYSSGSITNCYSTGAVSGSDYVGGLVGENQGYGYIGSISNCYSTGAVDGSSYVGGLVGRNYYGSIGNGYSTGDVSGNSYVGGLVGGLLSGYISKCYSTGAVSGSSNVGGLVGANYDGTISGCYFLITSGPDNGYGTPLTDEEMKQQSSFVGWDFVGETVNGPDDVWAIKETVDYPKLVWERVNLVGWYEVDFADFAAMANWWGHSDCETNNDCDGADFDFSGTVDMADLAIFTQYWLQHE